MITPAQPERLSMAPTFGGDFLPIRPGLPCNEVPGCELRTLRSERRSDHGEAAIGAGDAKYGDLFAIGTRLHGILRTQLYAGVKDDRGQEGSLAQRQFEEFARIGDGLGRIAKHERRRRRGPGGWFALLVLEDVKQAHSHILPVKIPVFRKALGLLTGTSLAASVG